MNAFAIQLFGLKSDNDSRRVFRFLTTAFAAYPDKDYCLMCLKCADQQSLPMMEILKFFIRVIPRPGCALEEHLYIAHRSAVPVFGEISLYELRHEDMPEVKNL
ncbi:hypothetical protein DOY81_014693 [Sarcophaga bullata]|nr:hypothetical protein DOY81_014693 [Sarcophaga bullata]